jgi:hypothetical protein
MSITRREKIFLCIMFLGVIVTGITGNIWYFIIGSIPMFISLVVQYLIWIRTWIQMIWRSYLGKIGIALLHGFVFLLSTIPARMLVAEALGLPPQDFDLTVTLFAVLFYLPLWLWVIVVLSMLLSIFFTVAFFVMMPLQSLGNINQMFEHLSSKIARFRQRIDDASSKIGDLFFGAMITLMTVMFITWYVWDSFPIVTRTLAPAVRAVAYFADYQKASAYPGVERNKKISAP